MRIVYNLASCSRSRRTRGDIVTSAQLTIIIVAGSLLVLLVGGFVTFVRYVNKNYKDSGVGSPLEAAKMRYAKGEISREKFEQIRKDLSQAPD